MTSKGRSFAAWLVLALALATPAFAQKHKELGRMWTFESVPLEFLEEAYGFSPSQQWLDHARLSSLRYGQGCSASFVSPRGLIMTNNHCARGNVAAVSPEGEDWLKTGYIAKSLAEEVKIPNLTVQQLVSMKDITAQVTAALDGVTDADRKSKTDEIKKKIEQEAEEANEGLTAQVVSLYQGGMYQLYMYKIYDDIRLVAFPHLQAAKFGGDPDNFTFPRFSLDYAFVRAWDGDKPANTSKHYFKWKTEGPKEGETVFVTGNPGSTGRLNTVAQMEFMRDAMYPVQLTNIRAQLKNLNRQAKKNKSPRLRNQILQLENANKAFTGYLEGLKNENVMEIKRKAEKAIRDKIDADDKLKERFGDAWTKLEEIAKEKTSLVLERPSGWRSRYEELRAQEATVTNRIGEAFFAVYGTDIPPDATFTLRFSDGVVKGFPMNGTIAPWFTSLYGLYARHCEFEGKEPFDLPDIWLKRQNRLDMTTRFNLVSTCDIIGGNSGSPMIDTDARIVGLVFDGNIESLGNRFVFTDDVPRTVCVHPEIIIESLRKIYDSGALADEIEGKADGYK